MTDVFLDVFNASIAATWVVLAVIAARLLLKKAPRWMVCALWVLVAVRLLWPGFLEAPFSLIPSSQIIPPQSLYDTAPQIDSGVAILDNAINPVYSGSLTPVPGASINPLQVWLAVYANVWVLGMGVMALWALWSCLRVRRQISERIPAEGNVYLCDQVESPFIFGLLRPIICLPSHLDGADRGHVIAHEMAHIARRDHWWKPLGFTLLTVNWFNPVMWVAYILLCRDIEMACDERVARNLDLADKKAYSSALLACSVRSKAVTVCPLAFGEVGVKQRVKSVLHYKKPAFWVILVTAVIIAILAACLLTNPVERVSELRYNGELYVLFNDEYSFLPADEPVGTLRSVLHRTKEHPQEELQATNLDKSCTGCPIYQEGENLYLVKYDGTCLAFRLSSVGGEQQEVLKDADPDLLGITLSVQNAGSKRLDLICVQQGRGEELSEIVTGTEWYLHKWDGDGWVNCMPRGIAWPEVAYLVNMDSTTTWSIDLESICGELIEGRYRIGKTFYGHPHPDGTKSTLEAYEQTCYAEFTVNPLGISLRVSNVTPSGLTLVCQQDGTLWTEIITGSQWMLEKSVDGQWVSIMPEETFWTFIAYLINQGGANSWNIDWTDLVGELGPGQYRIGKHFSAERRPSVTLNLPTEKFDQILYTEFFIG